MMSKNRLQLAFFIVLASFCVHFYLMNVHYNFAYGLTQQKSVCSINEKLDCESVSISPYAYFAGIPLATWGVAYHVAFLILFGFLFFAPEKKESTERWIRSFAALSLVASIAMATISLFMMKTYCIFCITLYALSLANVWVLFQRAEKPLFTVFEDFKWYPRWIVVLLIFIVAWVSDDMNKKNALQQVSGATQDSLSSWENAPKATLSNPILIEGANAQKAIMTISEFADFDCIHCRDSAHGLHSFVASKPDVRFEFYAFPLDGSCNPKMQNASSDDGPHCQLARAVYCSEKQGKGWQAHQWVFDRFGSDENMKFEKLISDLNLDANQFHSCLSSQEAFHDIEQNALLADQLHVDSTPTVFVNGKLLMGGNTVFVLEALYQRLHP